METTTFRFNEVKSAYIELYGNTYNTAEFSSFDDAFQSAWNSFDYVGGASNEQEFAQGMCECWQLQEF